MHTVIRCQVGVRMFTGVLTIRQQTMNARHRSNKQVWRPTASDEHRRHTPSSARRRQVNVHWSFRNVTNRRHRSKRYPRSSSISRMPWSRSEPGPRARRRASSSCDVATRSDHGAHPAARLRAGSRHDCAVGELGSRNRTPAGVRRRRPPRARIEIGRAPAVEEKAGTDHHPTKRSCSYRRQARDH